MFEVMKNKDNTWYILWYDKRTQKLSRTGRFKKCEDAVAAAEQMRRDNTQDMPQVIE